MQYQNGDFTCSRLELRLDSVVLVGWGHYDIVLLCKTLVTCTGHNAGRAGGQVMF